MFVTYYNIFVTFAFVCIYCLTIIIKFKGPHLVTCVLMKMVKQYTYKDRNVRHCYSFIIMIITRSFFKMSASVQN